MQSVVDSIVRSVNAPPAGTGLVVGVVQDGQCSVLGYGQAGAASSEPPDGGTIFEIGSISKVFTTTLLAAALADGVLRLEDPVCDLVPELSHWSPEIQLLHLATHTSGLPKMPTNIYRSMLRDRSNPYAAYSSANMLAYLSGHKPDKLPPAPVNYSNLGMALLGFSVAQRLGGSYEQVVVEKICIPLGLADTRITLTAEQQSRLAPPHSPTGKPGHNWDLPAFAGAGALRSTAADLLKFLAAHLGEAPFSFAAALPQTHIVRSQDFTPPGLLPRIIALLTKQGPDLHYRRGMAMGWTVGRLHSGETQICWHHGATGGYRAFAGFAKGTCTGVVVLANSGLGFVDAALNTTMTDTLGFKVLEHFAQQSDR